MKTYAETRGENPFDWSAFLSQETYSVDELEHAADLAAMWTTCACGNLCDIIPRRDITIMRSGAYFTKGEPLDEELKDLGSEFGLLISRMYCALKTADYKSYDTAKQDAIETLELIERRSTILIAEIYGQLKPLPFPDTAIPDQQA
jgi:hypothetical protein